MPGTPSVRRIWLTSPKDDIVGRDLPPAVASACDCVSRSACSLHLISSVGQRVKDEKNAARKPAVAFSSVDSSVRFGLCTAANNTEFSATFATTAGSVPAYRPRTMPSRLNVCMVQLTSPLYSPGKVCIFTFTVSIGWLT
uniref:Uncharacterized protein n=1 Tax=Anopheles atroparvus TaxID=41427 RepID=A0A182JKP3_ANOAO